MIPNLSRTVLRKSVPLVLKKVTKVMVSGRPKETFQEIPILGMLKPARMEKVIKASIDYNLKYMHYVGTNEVLIDDLIVFNNETYRCYALGDYSTYGFYKAELEQVKE